MNRQHFIEDPSEYAQLLASQLAIFHSDHQLPGQVFLEDFDDFRFLEFDLMLTERFWPMLANLATTSQDSEVIFTALEPDPEAYYFTHFHRYGLLRFNQTDSALDYYSALREEPPSSPADALLYVTSVASWFGTRKDWAFWGERDFGIGVAAKRDRSLRWPEIEGIKWFTVEDALSDLVEANFRNEEAFGEFAEQLRQNYQAK
jgi:hypothetical protein